MSILDNFTQLRQTYAELRKQGADPFAVTFDSMRSPVEATIDGQPVVVFGSNNYLGLTFDPALVDAGLDALRLYGTGTTGSRIANGTYLGHAELERKLAEFYGHRSAMVFTTGYQANLAMISTLAGRDDYLLLDADSHASIYDGSRLSAAQVIRFRHNDPDDLARRLRRLKDQPGHRLIVVEGIYSMLGDRARLAEIAQVKRESGASLLVDEAHSLGVLGHRGRGGAEEAGVEDDVDFIVGTFSKSLGAIGGFCTSNLPDFDVLRVCCRPYMFTASLPPTVIASVQRGLERLREAPELRQTLHRNAQRLYSGLAGAGFALGPQPGPIVSVRLPDTTVAVAFWSALLQAGIYVNLALPPATPDAHPLLRTSVTAVHTDAQIDQAVTVMAEIGTALGVLEPAHG